MGLPVAAVQVGVPDGISAMEHPAVPHIDAAMGYARRVIRSREENKVAGLGAACPGGEVVKPLRPQPPEVPAALIVDVGHEARAIKGRGRAVPAPHIGVADIPLRLGKNGCKGFIGQISPYTSSADWEERPLPPQLFGQAVHSAFR